MIVAKDKVVDVSPISQDQPAADETEQERRLRKHEEAWSHLMAFDQAISGVRIMSEFNRMRAELQSARRSMEEQLERLRSRG